MHQRSNRASPPARFVGSVPGLVFGLALACGVQVAAGAEAGVRHYTGCCDGSAAAPVNDRLFAAGSDEGNILRLYRRESDGPPVRVVDVGPFLGGRRGREADLEGAARIGSRIYWIGSHSRPADGRFRAERHVLFATSIRGDGEAAVLAPEGRPYRNLVEAMASDPRLAEFRLALASGLAGEARGGLNLEGLAEGPGETLLIGFRNPVPDGKALLVPVLNPAGVVNGEAPRFGVAHRLGLGGLGVRDFVRVGDRFLILAGPAEGGGRHRLFEWAGGDGPAAELSGVVPRGFQAESMVAGKDGFADLLSDDDSEKIEGKRCDTLVDASRRVFRALRVAWRP